MKRKSRKRLLSAAVQPEMLGVRGKYLKIVFRIVLFVSVTVMNDLATTEAAPQHLLSNKDVFANVSMCVGSRMSWTQQQAVAILYDGRFPTRVGVARARTVTRPIVSAGANDHRCVTSGARPRSQLPTACPRAEMLPARAYLARGSVEGLVAARAGDVGDQCSGTSRTDRGQFAARDQAGLIVGAHGVVASLSTEDSTYLCEATRGQGHRPVACCAASAHVRRRITSRLPWGVRDLSHFEEG